MASNEYVISLYRLLLDREPESGDVVKQHAQLTDDRKELLRAFLWSKEFLDRGLLPLEIGRHTSVEVLPVEVSASPEELREMLSGIAAKWKEFGNIEPYWSVVTNERFRSSKIDANREQFYASGQGNFDLAISAINRVGVDLSRLKTAIDYGCGVGRLTLAMARQFESVTGIDISAPHLRHAAQRAQEMRIENVVFKGITGVSDLSAFQQTDFIVSLIVLQHNPPPIMAEIFARLLRLLKKNGIAYIQIPTYIDGYVFKVADYLKYDKVDMEMNYLPQSNIFRIIYDEGCVPLEVREDSMATGVSVISHTFLIQKKGT